MGAYLAEPQTFQQNIFVEGLAYHHGVQHCWLGAHDLVTEGKWYWAHSGTEVSAGFTDWSPGQPDDNKNHQDCMVLNANYKMWDDGSCEGKYHPMCQMSASSEVVVG